VNAAAAAESIDHAVVVPMDANLAMQCTASLRLQMKFHAAMLRLEMRGKAQRIPPGIAVSLLVAKQKCIAP